MTTIKFDREQYVQGETATITYVDAPADGWMEIVNPTGGSIYSKHVSGSGTDTWAIPADASLGQYTVKLWSRSFGVTPRSDTMRIVSGEAPPDEPLEKFEDTGKITPATIEVEPGTYDVKFKLTGYKDKIILGVVVTEGTTKQVSATLESEFVPPVTKTVTFGSAPSGASVNIVAV